MTGAIQKKLPAGVSIILIVGVLIGVQIFWWKGLVTTGKKGVPRGGGTSLSGGSNTSIFIGRDDIPVTTISGDLPPGFEDGTGYNARFDRPTGLAIDLDGSLLVCDTGNHRIRRVASDGETSTVTGTAEGDTDGAALEAKFNSPCGVAVRADGSIVIADTGNHKIRQLKQGRVSTLFPKKSVKSMVTAFLPVGIAAVNSPAPYVLVSDVNASSILTLSAQGAMTSEKRTTTPALAILSSSAVSMAFPGSGDLTLGDLNLHEPAIEGKLVSGNGNPPAHLTHPIAICAFGSDVFVADKGFGAIFLVRGGKVEIIAGFCSTSGATKGYKDTNGSGALFGTICGLAYDGKKTLYVSDTEHNCIRRLDISNLLK